MTSVQTEKVFDSLISLFPPKSKETVVDWCERVIVLSELQTESPGPYSTALTPYVRDILNDFANARVLEITACMGAQTAKTQTVTCGALWYLFNNPCPAVWVMPNEKLAQSFSENRFQPIVEQSPILFDYKHPSKDKWKNLELRFKQAILNFIGSNSPTNLASRPARLLVEDETDKFKEATDKEANALELAEFRTRTYGNSKIVRTSTPTTEEGPIWQAYLAGDQRKYFIPCPHCSEKFTIEFKLLKWDETARDESNEWDFQKVRASAYIECPHCAGKIIDSHKTRMLRAGEWRPTNPKADPSKRSYHISALYAPWRKTGFGAIAVEFLQAKASLNGLQGFINGTLAEPWMNQLTSNSKRTEIIVPLTVKDESREGVERVLTSDKQMDHLWYLVRDWFPGGHSRLVAWGRVDDEDGLEEIRLKHGVFKHRTGEDSGFEATTVYRACVKYGWFALRGDDRESWTKIKNKKSVEVPYTTRLFDPLIGTGDQGKTKCVELRWSNPTIKDMLATLRTSEDLPIRWEVTEALATEEYWRHLDGEYKKKVFDNLTGKSKDVWVKRSRHWPNHLFDCECMQIATALLLGVLRDQTPVEVDKKELVPA